MGRSGIYPGHCGSNVKSKRRGSSAPFAFLRCHPERSAKRAVEGPAVVLSCHPERSPLFMFVILSGVRSTQSKDLRLFLVIYARAQAMCEER
jgi:hypothetical protein